MNSTRKIMTQYKMYQTEIEQTDPQVWFREYGFYLFNLDDIINPLYALIVGPPDTPYQGAMILVRINFPPNYPFAPPNIENMVAFPKQLNNNLWSADTPQSLINQNGDYKTYHGLICMDILNTPHSKMVTNAYGESEAVYDASREMYSPVQKISLILVSMRSSVLTEETKLPHITPEDLDYNLAMHFILPFFESKLNRMKKGEDKLYKLMEERLQFILEQNREFYDAKFQKLHEAGKISSEILERWKEGTSCRKAPPLKLRRKSVTDAP